MHVFRVTCLSTHGLQYIIPMFIDFLFLWKVLINFSSGSNIICMHGKHTVIKYFYNTYVDTRCMQ